MFGILSTNIALVLERVGETVLDMFVSQDEKVYNFLLYFLIVGLFEEFSKLLMLIDV